MKRFPLKFYQLKVQQLMSNFLENSWDKEYLIGLLKSLVFSQGSSANENEPWVSKN
jgi:hypothetical protein